MKKLFTLVTLLASMSLFFSCNQKQDTTIDQTPGLQTYTLTLSATKTPSTKELVLSGSTLNSVWGANDEVEVLYGEPKVNVGTLRPLSTGSATAVLSGTITASISPNDWVDLQFKGDFTAQDGSLEKVADWMKAWFQVESIDANKVIVPKASVGTADADGNVLFNNWTSIVRFNLKKKSDDSNLSASKMIIKTANHNLEGGSSNMLTVSVNGSASTLYVAVAHLDSNGDPQSDNYQIFVNTSDGVYSCSHTGKCLHN